MTVRTSDMLYISIPTKPQAASCSWLKDGRPAPIALSAVINFAITRSWKEGTIRVQVRPRASIKPRFLESYFRPEMHLEVENMATSYHCWIGPAAFWKSYYNFQTGEDPIICNTA
ncbi:hypothetical protein VTL71DRAFT_4346 [Oculimacula yallundae]|uniref:Uncharacterized protein n=1 Tax=Oculimacula yallundae TaxID=86028 RepID=A0ABR4C2D3_9HELO